MADDFEVPVGLFQDVEDLKAQLAQVTAQLRTLTEAAEVEPGPLPDQETPPDEAADEEEEDWAYPPFILLLEEPQYSDELRALIEWVEGVLVPAYLGEPSADSKWCHLWFEHPPAVARLHALWLAWQELTDPTSCGYTGPSVWHRDHLDPCLRELRAPNGPFAGCVKNEHQVAHRMPGQVPSAWSHTDS
ncbi:DUF4913 domain-containing protein [Streptomyces griseosporeus]